VHGLLVTWTDVLLLTFHRGSDDENNTAAVSFSLSSLLFHAGQAAIKLPSAEASKRAQCTSPGRYTPYIKGIMKTP